MTRILKVYRAKRFSPNSVERDRAIMDAVGNVLAAQGFAVEGTDEEHLDADCKADAYITMARTPKALALLKEKEREGCVVINSPMGVERCRRSEIDRIMRMHGLPAAPLTGSDGYWIKRGDEAAGTKDDVLFAANEEEKAKALQRFRLRGIDDVVVTAHVKGDLVKFYGVTGSGFFRAYPNDAGGYSKFGDEAVNGQPHGYQYDKARLQADAERTAALAGTDIYGGDCIVREDGTYAIIDFNDWPSFARCRDEAATAIAANILEKVKI